MNTETGEETNYFDEKEIRRLCTVYGVMQSNMLYRILTAKDKPELIAKLNEEVEAGEIEPLRGAPKCGEGQIWDEARKICV